ncbi:bacteriophage protein [Mycolicibacterium conceptionense]|uniref:Bacteriophage protein n=1 Tax=Mycolicibacterium conceptionense TaxID=451644 RepID=A0A0U1D333_9MYCO|nr:hypothetical protein [Mycolicibacterium conceptionense]ORV20963.1 hypothetical protein AWB98_01300 [Mycolicibacterium conceptionense]CQD07268.1 bacteriophage protein [Mycolicibacterium conceptionense]
MSFPTPHTVGHAVFTGIGEDDLGNDIETWADPVPVKVIAWQLSAVENINGYTSRVVADIDMAIPPDLVVSIQDRIVIPGAPKPFEVTAIEDANHGFHGWTPGSVLKLKAVTG